MADKFDIELIKRALVKQAQDSFNLWITLGLKAPIATPMAGQEIDVTGIKGKHYRAIFNSLSAAYNKPGITAKQRWELFQQMHALQLVAKEKTGKLKTYNALTELMKKLKYRSDVLGYENIGNILQNPQSFENDMRDLNTIEANADITDELKINILLAKAQIIRHYDRQNTGVDYTNDYKQVAMALVDLNKQNPNDARIKHAMDVLGKRLRASDYKAEQAYIDNIEDQFINSAENEQRIALREKLVTMSYGSSFTEIRRNAAHLICSAAISRNELLVRHNKNAATRLASVHKDFEAGLTALEHRDKLVSKASPESYISQKEITDTKNAYIELITSVGTESQRFAIAVDDAELTRQNEAARALTINMLMDIADNSAHVEVQDAACQALTTFVERPENDLEAQHVAGNYAYFANRANEVKSSRDFIKAKAKENKTIQDAFDADAMEALNYRAVYYQASSYPGFHAESLAVTTARAKKLHKVTKEIEDSEARLTTGDAHDDKNYLKPEQIKLLIKHLEQKRENTSNTKQKIKYQKVIDLLAAAESCYHGSKHLAAMLNQANQNPFEYNQALKEAWLAQQDAITCYSVLFEKSIVKNDLTFVGKLAKALNTPELSAATLSSKFILPVQRGPRYNLLLAQLDEVLPANTSVFNFEDKNILELIQDKNKSTNEHIRANEEQVRVKALAKQIKALIHPNLWQRFNIFKRQADKYALCVEYAQARQRLVNDDTSELQRLADMRTVKTFERVGFADNVSLRLGKRLTKQVILGLAKAQGVEDPDAAMQTALKAWLKPPTVKETTKRLSFVPDAPASHQANQVQTVQSVNQQTRRNAFTPGLDASVEQTLEAQKPVLGNKTPELRSTGQTPIKKKPPKASGG